MAPENIPRNNIKYCILCRRGLFFYTPDTLCLLRRSHFFFSLLIEIQCLVILIGIVVVTVVLAISVAISISISIKNAIAISIEVEVIVIVVVMVIVEPIVPVMCITNSTNNSNPKKKHPREN